MSFKFQSTLGGYLFPVCEKHFRIICHSLAFQFDTRKQGTKYIGYKKSLEKLDMDTLKNRREILCLNFALKSRKCLKTKHMFPENDKLHSMELRKPERYKVDHANTERFRKSSVIYMQNLLNKHEQEQWMVEIKMASMREIIWNQ